MRPPTSGWATTVRNKTDLVRRDIERRDIERREENDGVVTNELRRLGVPDAEGRAASPSTAQAEELRKTQEAAAKLVAA